MDTTLKRNNSKLVEARELGFSWVSNTGSVIGGPSSGSTPLSLLR